jgi:hypothetical protein
MTRGRRPDSGLRKGTSHFSKADIHSGRSVRPLGGKWTSEIAAQTTLQVIDKSSQFREDLWVTTMHYCRVQGGKAAYNDMAQR